MNTELCRKALDHVGNPNVLVNLISRRVRQLNTAGAGNRPLLTQDVHMGMADVALAELVEGKMSFEMMEPEPAPEKKAPKKRRRSS